jgi:hypothetical protein
MHAVSANSNAAPSDQEEHLVRFGDEIGGARSNESVLQVIHHAQIR